MIKKVWIKGLRRLVEGNAIDSVTNSPPSDLQSLALTPEPSRTHTKCIKPHTLEKTAEMAIIATNCRCFQNISRMPLRSCTKAGGAAGKVAIGFFTRARTRCAHARGLAPGLFYAPRALTSLGHRLYLVSWRSSQGVLPTTIIAASPSREKRASPDRRRVARCREQPAV